MLVARFLTNSCMHAAKNVKTCTMFPNCTKSVHFSKQSYSGFELYNRELGFYDLSRKRDLRCSFFRRLSFNSKLNINEKSSEIVKKSPELYEDELTKKFYIHPGVGHKVLLIQPRIKFGHGKESPEVANLKLDEAVSLVNTLKGWSVGPKCVISVTGLDSSLVIGTGNREKLKSVLQQDSRITAVFIGMDILTSLQNTQLQEYFKVPVFDRYQIILQIFYNHAKTKDAKLQIALAQIPYLRVKLCSYSYTWDGSLFPELNNLGGSGETPMEIRRRILDEREMKLNKEIEKIRNQRQALRQSSSRKEIPIVAIVGYTNCGKTTLIKSLTDDSRLEPEDKLFATLDVTLHVGLLPSNQKVLFVDTVGFISDVPTSLIKSFESTLEEINAADLVVHVRDISNPNADAQKKTVLKTLKDLKLPSSLMESIVEVKNKIDLLNEPMPSDSDAVHISAMEGTGLSELLEVIEERLFQNTGHTVHLFRVPNGGTEYRWLLKEAAIRDAMADPEDANFLILEVVVSSEHLSKFIHQFGDLRTSIEDIKLNS